MYSKSQDGVARRLRWWALVAVMLVVGGLDAGEAWADIQVHVMNCTEDTVEAEAFDSKDSVRAVSASKKTFPSFKQGESATLHCAGEGKGYCQMQIGPLDLPLSCKSGDGNSFSAGHIGFHLESDKWAVVTGFVNDGSNCKPVVEQNLDSAPSSCN